MNISSMTILSQVRDMRRTTVVGTAPTVAQEPIAAE